MATKFKVTAETTLGALDQWMGLRPSITTTRVRQSIVNPVTRTRGYRAIFEISNEVPVMGDSADSLAEALDSAVRHVEDLFPL